MGKEMIFTEESKVKIKKIKVEWQVMSDCGSYDFRGTGYVGGRTFPEFSITKTSLWVWAPLK